MERKIVCSKKRYHNKEFDYISFTESLLRKVIRNVKSIDKDFKFNNQIKNILQYRFEDSIERRSQESIFSIVIEEIPHLKEKTFDSKFMVSPFESLLLSFPKPRKYDIDSNKKLLRKSAWNYLIRKLNLLTKISNIKTIDQKNSIKNDTKKEFEKILFESTVEKLLEEYYNLRISVIFSNIQVDSNDENEQSKKQKEISSILEMTFKDVLIEYRETDDYWTDINKSCCMDSEKALTYLKLTKKFINYIYYTCKVNLDNLPDDIGISSRFLSKEQEFLACINQSVNNQNHNQTPRDSRPSEVANTNVIDDTSLIHTRMNTNLINSSLTDGSQSNDLLEKFKTLNPEDQSTLFTQISNFMGSKVFGSCQINFGEEKESYLQSSPNFWNDEFQNNNFS